MEFLAVSWIYNLIFLHFWPWHKMVFLHDWRPPILLWSLLAMDGGDLSNRSFAVFLQACPSVKPFLASRNSFCYPFWRVKVGALINCSGTIHAKQSIRAGESKVECRDLASWLWSHQYVIVVGLWKHNAPFWFVLFLFIFFLENWFIRHHWK